MQLGLSVRGPGCSAPSRYIDLMSYYQWIQKTLESFRSLTITKITPHQFVLRASKGSTQKYGACDEEEQINLIYRDNIKLVTDSDKFQMFTYNLSMYQSYEYSCVVMKLVDATVTSEMKIRHMCTRYSYGPACYTYKGTAFQLTVYMTVKESCQFDIQVYGWPKNMTLLDIHTWKFEEGTYYEDFTMTKVEYKGPLYETEFGFEPVDEKLWVPEYDIWTTTSGYVTDKYITTTELPKSHDDIWEAPPGEEGYDYKPTFEPKDFGRYESGGEADGSTTTEPSSTSTTTSLSTSPPTSPLTLTPISPPTLPLTSSPTSPPTSPSTSPPTSPSTSPPTSTPTSPPTSASTSPPTSPEN